VLFFCSCLTSATRKIPHVQPESVVVIVVFVVVAVAVVIIAVAAVIVTVVVKRHKQVECVYDLDNRPE